MGNDDGEAPVSTTLEAGTDTSAEEAANALTDHERAAAAAETGLTQEQREASAGDGYHDTNRDTANDERAPSLELDSDSWAEIVGGDLPTEVKMAFAGTAFTALDPPEIKKGSSYIMVLDVKAVGHGVRDTLDSDTGDVSATKMTKLLKVRSARFLKPNESIAAADDEAFE